jgi:hypothetical protein
MRTASARDPCDCDAYHAAAVVAFSWSCQRCAVLVPTALTFPEGEMITMIQFTFSILSPGRAAPVGAALTRWSCYLPSAATGAAVAALFATRLRGAGLVSVPSPWGA